MPKLLLRIEALELDPETNTPGETFLRYPGVEMETSGVLIGRLDSSAQLAALDGIRTNDVNGIWLYDPTISSRHGSLTFDGRRALYQCTGRNGNGYKRHEEEDMKFMLEGGNQIFVPGEAFIYFGNSKLADSGYRYRIVLKSAK